MTSIMTIDVIFDTSDEMVFVLTASQSDFIAQGIFDIINKTPMKNCVKGIVVYQPNGV